MKKLILSGVAACVLAAAAPAIAADMPVKALTAPALVASWSGPYIGLSAGYGFGRSEHFNLGTGGRTGEFGINGFVGGATLGWNRQAPGSALVWGLETDISYSKIYGSIPPGPTFGCGGSFCETAVEWFGTVRGRLGIAMAERLMPFVTAGFAYGNVRAGVPSPALPIPPTVSSKTTTGWTAGIGIEWAFAPNWSAKLEYLHVDLGNFIHGVSSPVPNPLMAETRFDVVRGGVNLRF